MARPRRPATKPPPKAKSGASEPDLAEDSQSDTAGLAQCDIADEDVDSDSGLLDELAVRANIDTNISADEEEHLRTCALVAVDVGYWSTECSSQSLTDCLLSRTVDIPTTSAPLASSSLADIEDFLITSSIQTKKKAVQSRNGINTKLPPMSNLQDIFEDIALKSTKPLVTDYHASIQDFMDHIGNRKLRVGTICSGTESPILALQLITSGLRRLGQKSFEIEHAFSCEIEAFKQSYIERNFNPPILFRDVREFAGEHKKATSIYNASHTIPDNLDILIAGFSCKDFSTLNNSRKTLEQMGESGQTFLGIKAYCEKFRPRIVILENIRGCQWDAAKQHLRDVGYFTEHILVDTKNYYLPQTRNRGYLLALDASHKYFPLAANYVPTSKNEKIPAAEETTEADADGKNRQKTLFEAWGGMITEKKTDKKTDTNVETPTAQDPDDGEEATGSKTSKARNIKKKAKVKTLKPKGVKIPNGEIKDNQPGDHMTNLWIRLMRETFHRPASSPFFDFMMHDEDPTLLAIKQRLSHDGSLTKGARIFDWVACRGRYQGERVEKQLGFQRPVTRWQSNGTCKTLDHIWVNWAKRQAERVLDTLDISFLRKLEEEDLDINYKPRLIELSQNVDRETDRRSPGILPCILPGGLPYVTTRGGILTGRESLSLQGLPVKNMIITRETNNELQDLAGNAMSSTVVGCAITAALMCGYRILDRACEAPEIDNQQDSAISNDTAINSQRKFQMREKQVMQSSDILLEWQNTSADKLLSISQGAARSIQLCPCEGMKLVKSQREFWLCRDCGDIRCTNCKGNPPHNYVQLRDLDRLDPTRFETFLRAELPSTIKITGLAVNDLHVESWFVQGSRPKSEVPTAGVVDKEYKDGANITCKREWESLPDDKGYISYIHLDDMMLMTKVERRHVWTVTYESSSTKLELIIRPRPQKSSGIPEFCSQADSSTFEWLLFIKPHRREPLGSKVFEILSTPFARMRPENGLLDGTWEVRGIAKQLYDASIKGIDSPIPSWEKQQGLQNTDTVYSKLVVQVKSQVKGGRIPDEIQSLNGTYQLFQSCGTAMGSLHKQIWRSDGSASTTNRFLFLDPGCLSSPEDDSFVFAEDHHRLTYPDKREVICRVASAWRLRNVCPEKQHEHKVGTCKQVRLETPGLWTEKKGMQLVFPTVPLACSVVHHDQEIQLRTGSCHDANIHLLKYHTLLNEAQKQQCRRGELREIKLVDRPEALLFSTFINYRLSDIIASDWKHIYLVEGLLSHDNLRCESCAPEKPGIKFEEYVDINCKKTTKPMEDKQGTNDWENKIKNRPTTLLGHVNLAGDHASVLIEANVTTLAHRAIATLLDMGALEQDASNLKSVSWRIAKEEITEERLDFGQLTIKSNTEDKFLQACPQPPSFLAQNLSLRPEQLRSLQWMKFRESNSAPPFEQMVIEEACLPALGARLEAKVVVDQPICGGIVADEVGYGKTAIILGLIDSTWNDQSFVTKTPGLKSTQATLIIVPNIILDQWHNEAKRFLGWNDREIVVIKNTNSPVTAADIEDARCVIVSHSMLASTGYYRSLAKVSGSVVEAPSRPGRAYDAWLTDRLEEIKARVEESETTARPKPSSSTATADDDNEDDLYASSEADSRKRKVSGRISSGTSKTGAKRLKLDDLPAVLQLFHFRRIVVDEYTYLEGRPVQMAQKLSANAKWIISGTPDVSNFASVNEMACFLGARLGPDDDREGLYKSSGNLDVVARDRTLFEDFQSYQTRHSTAWHKQRHSRAQEFLDDNARQNKAEIQPIPVETHFNLVMLSPAERFFYAAVYHHLMSRDMTWRQDRGKTKSKNRKTTLKMAVQDLFRDSEHGLEALIRACSVPVPIQTNHRHMLEDQGRELAETTHHLMRNLRRAYTIQNDFGAAVPPNAFSNFQTCVAANAYGDLEAMQWIKKLLTVAHDQAVEASKAKLGDPKDKSEKARIDDLKALSNPITDLTLDFVEHLRGLRQFVAMAKTLELDLHGAIPCSSCGRPLSKSKDIFISLVCGHVLCNSCLEQGKSSNGTCQVNGCNGAVLESSVISAEQYCSVGIEDQTKSTSNDGSSGADKTATSSKMVELARLLTEDSRIGADDKVVVFVQYEALAKEIELVLETNKIQFVSIAGSEKINRDNEVKLRDFQDSTKKYRVCILRIESPSAAGINLQCANHVIFVSTLIKTSDQKYKATMTQAIGRVKRFGQRKRVHVWHVLAAHTIDVNILQLREQGVLVKKHNPQQNKEMSVAETKTEMEESQYHHDHHHHNDDHDDQSSRPIDDRNLGSGANDGHHGVDGADPQQQQLATPTPTTLPLPTSTTTTMSVDLIKDASASSGPCFGYEGSFAGANLSTSLLEMGDLADD